MEAKGIDALTPYGLETAVLGHPAGAELGLIGRADELQGEVISAFVVLKQGFITSNKSLKRRQTVTAEQKKLIRRIRSIWFDSGYNHNSQQFVGEMGSLVTALDASADDCGALEIAKMEWKGVTYTKPEHVQFVNDMITAGERDNLMCYHGSPLYYGPAVSVPNVQDALGATQVRCHWDNLGLGFIVHPCVSDQALSEAYDTEA
jgi:AMP-binding enzyme